MESATALCPAEKLAHVTSTRSNVKLLSSAVARKCACDAGNRLSAKRPCPMVSSSY